MLSWNQRARISAFTTYIWYFTRCASKRQGNQNIQVGWCKEKYSEDINSYNKSSVANMMEPTKKEAIRTNK